MGWIYGFNELEYAIQEATNFSTTSRVALAEITEAYKGGGLSNVYNLANSYGVSPIFDSSGNFMWYQTSNLPSVTTQAPSVFAEALEVDVVESTAETVVSKTLPAIAEKGIEKGAVSTVVKVAPIVGAVATGIGLGVNAYKNEPALWTDISNSIFTGNVNNLVSVLARKQSGKYISYVSETDVANIIQKFAKFGVFDVDSVESDIETSFKGGNIPVTFTSVGAPPTKSGALAYQRFVESAPAGNIIVGYYSSSDYTDDEITVLYTLNPSTAPRELYVRGYTEPAPPTTGVPWADVECFCVSCVVEKSTGQVQHYQVYTQHQTVASGVYQKTDKTEVVGGLNVNVVHTKGTNPLFYVPELSANTLNNIAPSLSLDSIKTKLREKFPNWYNDSFDTTKIDPKTGAKVTETQLPLGIPNVDPYENPTGDPTNKQDPTQKGEIDPETKPNPITEDMPELNPETDIPVPPPTPTPDDPEGGIIGGGGAKGLWAVYNPTIPELTDLGGYLWSSNVIDILQKFLNNPMDCIISLHMIYATPSTGARRNIILGYLDSGVSSSIVTEQFITIDCGTVDVAEYFGDARDYTTPYTQVECYLPFVGIVKLKTEDIIGGKVNIVYTVDVLTGALLCKIFVTKLGSKQQLYTYSGNCSVQIPLTGADRTRLLSGAISGASTGLAVGGGVGAVVGGVVGGLFGGSSIDRSSGFTANSGAMGIKIPYLIITRKYSYDASKYNEFYGYPSNVTLTLSTCKGYTRVKSVHVDGISEATENEKNEIETLLMNGVIIN